MKDGMRLGDFLQEVQRRSENKMDYIRSTRSLRMQAFPTLSDDVANVLGRSSILSDGPIAFEDLSAGGLASTGREIVPVTSNGHALATVKKPNVQLLVPHRNDPGVDSLNLNSIMHDQLGGWLGIPARYYDRMLSDFPELLAANVNTLLQAAPADEKRTIRSLDGTARAFLSDAYEPIDNYDLMNYLMPLFVGKTTYLRDGTAVEPIKDPNGNLLKVSFRSVNVTDSHLYAKLVVPVLQAELKVGATIRIGVLIKNSEVGFSQIVALPFYEVLQCTNGAVISNMLAGISRRHVGRRKSEELSAGARFIQEATKKERMKVFFMEMADIIRGTLTETMLTRISEPLVASMGRPITGHVDAVVDHLGKRMDLGGDEQQEIMRYLIDGGDLSQWGLSNAITRYSQDVDSYDRASELEKLGGDVITLSPSDWHVISSSTRPAKAKAASAA